MAPDACDSRSTPAPSPPGLYLHIPFCSAICPYCDFAVTTGDADHQERFVGALMAEIRRDHPRGRGHWSPFDTVYLGGGTPSALSAEHLGRILESIRESLPLAARVRTSIEANPEDVDRDSVRIWSELGIDRLSLGVQSFDPEELEFLGRRHDPTEARLAVEAGLAAGITVSIDLIYGLPNRSTDSWQSNLQIAVDLEPHHISCYQLTVEAGTPFAAQSRRGLWSEPDANALAELFFRTHEFLGGSGYPAYEVSNFALAPEHRCDHNRKYWEGADYLGLGPSAHSFDGESRWWNQRSEPDWRRAVEEGRGPEGGREMLTRDQRVLERLMLGLRTPRGVDLGSFEGVNAKTVLERNAEVLSRSVDQGLLEVRAERLVPTLAGMARADAIARTIQI